MLTVYVTIKWKIIVQICRCIILTHNVVPQARTLEIYREFRAGSILLSILKYERISSSTKLSDVFAHFEQNDLQRWHDSVFLAHFFIKQTFFYSILFYSYSLNVQINNAHSSSKQVFEIWNLGNELIYGKRKEKEWKINTLTCPDITLCNSIIEKLNDLID